MTKRKPAAQPEYRVGPDVNLADEDVRDSKGRRITEDYARRAAEYDPATVHRGRQSLTGGATHSPRVSFRVPEHLREAAEQAATREGRTVSELARDALQKYLAS
jgi:CopG-like RHH_1 or ribbon-helix-helix domain, RHH_5